MDLPSATEAQSQRPQKNTQHDKKQQQPLQDSAYQPYDLSQLQEYEAYHPYAQPYALHQQYYQQHPYCAYDYFNALAAVNAYQEVEFPPGLEPAAGPAVTALSQVSQFAGKMDAVEQAMVGMPDQLWSNGAYIQMPGQRPFFHGAISFQPNVGTLPCRGRRGGESFRGDRGSFDQHNPWSDSGAPDGRGRDRMGRSGRRRFPCNASDVILLSYEPASYQEPKAEATPVTESTAAQATDSAVAPATSQGRQRTPQIAWCDLCKVDCNTQEILQQHKNGKRHKKNMQKLEEFQEHKNILLKSQQLTSGQPLPVLQGEESYQTSVEDLAKATVTTDENEIEEQATLTKEQVGVLTTGLTEATIGKSSVDGSFEYQEHPFKRKLQKRVGRGGKRVKQSESVSCSGPPKEQPKYCALCHVTCDTQAVFESHLAGKKHINRVKKAKGSQGKYRALGLHALYMPDAQQTGSEAPVLQDPQIKGPKSIVQVDGEQAVRIIPAGQDTKIAEAVYKSDGNAALAIHSKRSTRENGTPVAEDADAIVGAGSAL